MSQPQNKVSTNCVFTVVQATIISQEYGDIVQLLKCLKCKHKDLRLYLPWM